jgi:hypothetical protein
MSILEDGWENRLRSLQSKLANTKSLKLQALEIQLHGQMFTVNENTIRKQLNEYKKETKIDKSTNISILKDGYCFFHCISEYLNDTQEEHEQIREEVIDTSSANKQFYSQLINGKFEQLIHNMKQTDGHTNTWTTESEIIAASKTFNIEIFVQSMINGKHEWIRYSRNSDCDHSIQFKAIRHQNNHFSLIQINPEHVLVHVEKY